jgi:hypothetical protein
MQVESMPQRLRRPITFLEGLMGIVKKNRSSQSTSKPGWGNEIANNGKRLKPEEQQVVDDGEGNVCSKELMSLKK